MSHTVVLGRLVCLIQCFGEARCLIQCIGEARCLIQLYWGG